MREAIMDSAKFGGQETIQTKDTIEDLLLENRQRCFFGTIGKNNLLHKSIWEIVEKT